MDRDYLQLADPTAPAGTRDAIDDRSFNLGLAVGSDAAFRCALKLAVAMPAYAEQMLSDIDAYTDCMKASLASFEIPHQYFDAAVKDWQAKEEYAGFLVPPPVHVLVRAMRKLVGGG